MTLTIPRLGAAGAAGATAFARALPWTLCTKSWTTGTDHRRFLTVVTETQHQLYPLSLCMTRLRPRRLLRAWAQALLLWTRA